MTCTIPPIDRSTPPANEIPKWLHTADCLRAEYYRLPGVIGVYWTRPSGTCRACIVAHYLPSLDAAATCFEREFLDEGQEGVCQQWMESMMDAAWAATDAFIAAGGVDRYDPAEAVIDPFDWRDLNEAR